MTANKAPNGLAAATALKARIAAAALLKLPVSTALAAANK